LKAGQEEPADEPGEDAAGRDQEAEDEPSVPRAAEPAENEQAA